MEPQSSKGNLKAVILTWEHCQALAPRLANAEAMECTANGYTPEQALSAGLLFGLSWAVLRDEVLAPPWCAQETVLGAFGYTNDGAIWSLWGPLSRKESVIVLDLSREWIRELVRLSSRRFLRNTVHAKNTRAIKWLTATGCFNLDLANPRRNLDGTESYAFETIPELAPTRKLHRDV